jgi:hypothetical protein
VRMHVDPLVILELADLAVAEDFGQVVPVGV